MAPPVNQKLVHSLVADLSDPGKKGQTHIDNETVTSSRNVLLFNST